MIKRQEQSLSFSRREDVASMGTLMGVTAPAGFVASSIAGGIKGDGRLDMALIANEGGQAVPCAATFTANKAAAAPVQVSTAYLRETNGYVSAVLLTSGNANAATGAKGISDAEELCSLVARRIGNNYASDDVASHDVLICQTGLIGIPFPMDAVRDRVDSLVDGLGNSREHGELAAKAIMTTDKAQKEVYVDGGRYSIGGMAKGAAMLAPNMATMLAVLCTDAGCDPGGLQDVLRAAVDDTFNRISVDGCTSTNDTVVLLANGRAGSVSPDTLYPRVREACMSLAMQMADDAEGSTKTALISVEGASSDSDAARAARKVAESQLVQCSLYGEDPYWGRVTSELGSSGAAFDIDRLSISYGDILVCRDGVAVDHDHSALERYMHNRSIEIKCNLGLGGGKYQIITTDLSYGYIDENRTTS